VSRTSEFGVRRSYLRPSRAGVQAELGRYLLAFVYSAFVTGASAVCAQSGETSPQPSSPTPAPAPASDAAVTTQGSESTPATNHPPSFSERMRTWAQNAQLFERMNGDVNGWYPRIGGVTRGSGFAGGIGYRYPLAGEALLADVSAAISTKGYTAFDAKLRVLQLAQKRVELWTELRLEDFPEEDFYGIGMDSPSTARTSYDYNDTDVRLRLVLQPRRWARLTTVTGYMHPDVGRGADRRYPSIDEIFTDTESPGLLQQPDFLHAMVTGEIDTRDTGGNTIRGGYYRASFGLWNDVSLNTYNFHRADLLAVQYVPLTRSGAHVVSGRIGAVGVSAFDDSRIPFYFLPYAGGMDTIRSVPEFRYKDQKSMWLSGEYKWRLNTFLSVSTFADVGQVTPDWHSLSVRDMEAGYGVSVGVYGTKQTLLRVDVGTGAGQGWQFFIRLRPPF
jgi:hypothetical protein